MKTKKAILKWWEDRGSGTLKANDLGDFLEKVHPDLKIEKKRYGHEDIFVECTLIGKNWKYPMYLIFYDRECIKIIGF